MAHFRIINVDFDTTGKLQIIYTAFVKHLRKKRNATKQLFIDFKTAYASVRREILFNSLVEFDIPMKLVGLMKMCLAETYSRFLVGKNLSDMFPIRNGLKQGVALSPLPFNFVLEYAIMRVQVN